MVETVGIDQRRRQRFMPVNDSKDFNFPPFPRMQESGCSMKRLDTGFRGHDELKIVREKPVLRAARHV